MTNLTGFIRSKTLYISQFRHTKKNLAEANYSEVVYKKEERYHPFPPEKSIESIRLKRRNK